MSGLLEITDNNADMPILRHDWQAPEVAALFELPFAELLYRAHGVHRSHWDPTAVQASTLLSIKTGACPEDCAYCPQSVRYQTGLETEPLMDEEEVLASARRARDSGASRFCMGAAWRSPKDRDLPALARMIEAVRGLGMETCMTLGMLTEHQSEVLAEAGLDYYNHNLDTSPEFYNEIITTRSYRHRLDTLENVRRAGMKVCCGGIVGMGERREDRIGLLLALANLPEHPQSVPINRLVAVTGTPLAEQPPLDELEFIRMIAAARIMMPRSVVRLSAGRETMSDSMQALAFMAGANSIFLGDKLLTTANPERSSDLELLSRLGLAVVGEAQTSSAPPAAGAAAAERRAAVAQRG